MTASKDISEYVPEDVDSEETDKCEESEDAFAYVYNSGSPKKIRLADYATNQDIFDLQKIIDDRIDLWRDETRKLTLKLSSYDYIVKLICYALIGSCIGYLVGTILNWVFS